MPDATTLPLEELLAPLPGDSPIGGNLRADDTIDPALRSIRDLAKQATYKERKAGDAGEDPTYAALSDWQQIVDESQQVLREASKDLEVSALLVEALVRTSGLAGLADGLTLAAELSERYWTDILSRARAAFPEPDDEAIVGDLLGRMNKWNDSLPLPIVRVPLTSGGDGSYALWQYEQGVEADKGNLPPEEREVRKIVSIEQFSTSVVSTATSQPAEIRELFKNLARAKAQAERIESLFQERLEGDLANHVPGLGKVKDRLDDIQRCLQHTGGSALAAAIADEGEAAGGPDGEAAAAAGGGASGKPGELTTREQAFQELSRIADFFARTEPLSLLAEQIRQIVHRGRLPADAYYKDLIDDENTLRQFFRLVGIKPPGDESS